MERLTRDEWAMAIARITALRSTCSRRCVGAVILSEKGHVLSTGYNGVASGVPHCNEGFPCGGESFASGQGLDECQAIHAEQNALLQCRDIYQIHSIYITCAPCMTCMKLLLNTSCKRIVFKDDYPNMLATKEKWVDTGRLWVKFSGRSVLFEAS